jgi:hypothetical protein
MIGAILCLAVLLCAAACSGGATARTGGGKGVEDVLKERMAETSDASESAASGEETAPRSDYKRDPSAASVPVDVDLSVLSGMLVYSEVYNMMTAPETYVGKTVKMSGQFTYFCKDADTFYYSCVIADATACCLQGIEFIPGGTYVFPDDYPLEGEEITVVGVFDTYTEGDVLYCTLRDAKLF